MPEIKQQNRTKTLRITEEAIRSITIKRIRKTKYYQVKIEVIVKRVKRIFKFLKVKPIKGIFSLRSTYQEVSLISGSIPRMIPGNDEKVKLHLIFDAKTIKKKDWNNYLIVTEYKRKKKKIKK